MNTLRVLMSLLLLFLSMEGSLCKLPEIVELKKKYKVGLLCNCSENYDLISFCKCRFVNVHVSSIVSN